MLKLKMILCQTSYIERENNCGWECLQRLNHRLLKAWESKLLI